MDYFLLCQKFTQDLFVAENDFELTFSDILMAGVETSDGIFCSICLLLTLYPEKQEKLAREIATKFPKDHVFSFLDLKM